MVRRATIILQGMQPPIGGIRRTSSASIPTTSSPASASYAGDHFPWTEADDDRIDLHLVYRLAQLVIWTGATMGVPTSSWIW